MFYFYITHIFVVPDKVWKIEELVLNDTKEIDFGRSDTDNWWNVEPLKTLDLSSNSIKKISPDVKFLQHLVTLKVRSGIGVNIFYILSPH